MKVEGFDFTQVLEFLKETNQKNVKSDSDKAPHPLYTTCKRQFNKIRVHSEDDFYPKTLFEVASPNRTKAESDYIKANYQNITLPVYTDFVNSVKRSINRGNYSIEFPEDQQDYFNKGLPKYKSIFHWFNTYLLDHKLKDANGFIAVKPQKIETIIHDEQEIVSPEQSLEPIPYYYDSTRILSYGDDHLLVMSYEKTVVKYYGTAQKVGVVMELFTKEGIYRIEQKGNFVDWEFDQVDWFKHNLGSPTWIQLKGMPEIRDGHVYYNSPFNFAVSNLDMVTVDSMNLKLSKENTVFPYRVMVGDPCDFVDGNGQQCTNGRVMTDGNLSPCPQCHGSGYTDKPERTGSMIIDPDDIGEIGLERISFVSPPTDGLEFVEKAIERHESRARDILHLTTTTSEGQPSDTATGRLLDMKSLYAFIAPISDEAFDVLEFVLKISTYMRYDTEEVPTVNRPVDFDLKTAQDYLNEYKSAVEKGAPPIVIFGLLKKYIQQTFYTSQESENIFNLVMYADRLITFKSEDLQVKLGRTVEAWEVILHDSSLSFVSELINDDDKFLSKDLKDQKEAMIALAKERAGAMQSKNPQSIVDELTGKAE